MFANRMTATRAVLVGATLLLGLMTALRLVSAETSAAGTDFNVYLPFIANGDAETPSDTIPYGPVHTGPGTFYDFADGGGNCLFEPTPDDLMVAAINHFDYDNAALCGTYARVDGPDGLSLIHI